MKQLQLETLAGALREARVPFEENRPLSLDTSFRIGGPAALSAEPRDENGLLTALRLAKEGDVPVLVIGNGSNLLVSDDGFDGLVLRTTGMRGFTQEENRLTAACGVGLSRLSAAARDASLAGLSFAFGIPGTVGGAVCMNAGAYGGQIADVLLESRYYDPADDTIHTLDAVSHAFGYRDSVYLVHPSWTVLSAVFVLQPGEREALDAEMREFMARRRDKQPLEYPSAGSVFKRPEGHFAGALIEQCGLKGCRVGDAEVSGKHAGFIVNRGEATADDVLRLIERIKKTVLSQTGVTLECEVRCVGKGGDA